MAFATSFVVLFSLLLSGSVSKVLTTTTIKTKHGVYDCVDFYQQPAFDNPLLKNNNLTSQGISKNKLAEIQAQNTEEFGLEDGGCPIGTVPILRATANSTHFPQTSSSNGGDCVAVVETVQTKKYYGMVAGTSLHKPKVGKTQWSAARLRLKNGIEFLEVGWMVNPDKYKDNEAHLYVNSQSRKKECSSHSCFVQVARGVPLGLVPKHYSQLNGAQWCWNFTIIKHEDDGHWWLTIDPKLYIVGYWPKESFVSLAYLAEQAEWGGEISRGSLPRSELPEMGAGQPADLDPQLSAHIWRVGLIEYFKGAYQAFTPEDTTTAANCKSYTVEDGSRFRDPFFGYIILYGGPGT